MKRILPWLEHKEDMQWTASASTGSYIIICWIRGTFSAFRTVTTNNAYIGVPEHYTLDAAMDACEADYIERCSEFLRVAAPGECVVNAQHLLSLANATCKDTCQACDSDAECGQCWVEMLRRESTAAIDAAKGE